MAKGMTRSGWKWALESGDNCPIMRFERTGVTHATTLEGLFAAFERDHARMVEERASRIAAQTA